MLLDGLPVTSLTKTWLRDHVEVVVDTDAEKKRKKDPEFGPWGLVNHQLADVMDLLQQSIRATYEASGGKVSGQYKPAPRPKQKVRFGNSTAADELKAEAAAHHARRVAAGLEEG